MYKYIPVYTGMYWYILVHTSMDLKEQVCTGMYWYVLVHTSMYQDIQVYTGVYRYILVHSCLWKPYYEVANALVQGSTDHIIKCHAIVHTD